MAILVLEDLAIWQELNVTALLATGIAAAAPEAMGQAYVDAAGRRHAPLPGQPMLIFGTGPETLLRAYRAAIACGLTRHLRAGHVLDRSRRGQPCRRVLAEPAEAPDLDGLALRGPRRGIDKATKRALLHP